MNYKNLFLRQSYLDNYDIYQKSLGNSADKPNLWDYVILTASNDDQAEAYRMHIDYRVEHNFLPNGTHYAVIPDYEGKRIGSGGATFGAMRYIMEREADFNNLKIMVIHSGGDSKRVPQYSACGKLFSPVPRELPDGRRSTLFDEFIIGMSGMPNRIGQGMLVLSGDVLLLFNPLQIDFYSCDAAAVSIKEHVSTGKNHGVFLKDENGYVSKFLHKQTEETLNASGAVDKAEKVNIDTGAIVLGSNILNDLYKLIDTEEKFNKYVNETVRLSFYADFVYPLANGSTLEDFYKEKPEGEINDSLLEARSVLWNTLHKYTLKLICLSPASFLHFGTSKELLSLVTESIDDYKFLDWKSIVNTNREEINCAVYNSCIDKNAVIGRGSYLENSIIDKGTVIGKNCIISGVSLKNITVPDNVILHGLKLKNGKFVVRMLGINDNPKENFILGKKLNSPLWDEPLFAEYDTMEEAARATVQGVKGSYSLKSSFNYADVTQILPWQDKLNDRICSEKIVDAITAKTPLSELTDTVITARVKKYLLSIAETSDFSLKIRIYYYVSRLSNDEILLKKCFDTIRDDIVKYAIQNTQYNENNRIVKDSVTVKLPVRVNWAGGWSDTPPYCNEHGGMVLNAAITLEGQKPIVVTAKKIKENKFILSSTDNGSYGEFTDISKLQDCQNPHDAFALHKAALIACGIIPFKEQISVEKICSNLGGGLHLNTEVLNIPKGSGLGTSSILAGACVKAIYQMLGVELPENDMYTRVVCMEQIMSTGGGWQDQVGGLAPGIKMVSSEAGMQQFIKCDTLNIPNDALKELEDRFYLIYTGQRRLARNLLREIVGKYIAADPDALYVLYKIQQIAVLMRFELERGNIDGFCRLLNEHWELSKKLDSGCTNTCIDQIFNSIDDLIEARMICGAGGGGFLQVVTKKGITGTMLRERLWEVFEDSGVSVYDCNFYF